ncbi:MAG: hypothetical protein PHC61_10540 [Chitinivibrionales bacterium]|nr:hypothetical protein [Chitinivibrionales bacterium]
MNKIFALLVGALLFAGPAEGAQLTRVDSVTVDSVWNADTTNYSGALKPRRNVKVSFKPIAGDSVYCIFDVSLDSGKTWIYNRDFIEGKDSVAAVKAAPNKKSSLVLRLNCGDTARAVFRVTARSDSLTASQFRLSNQIGGWADTGKTYAHFANSIQLQGLIDGGYASYSAFGMVNGFEQQLVDTTDTLFNQIFACDMGSAGRAKAKFTNKKSNWPNLDTAAFAAADTTAAAQDILGGISVIAHYRHFYFEMSLSGYQQLTNAINDAKTFLAYFRQKAGL